MRTKIVLLGTALSITALAMKKRRALAEYCADPGRAWDPTGWRFDRPTAA